MEDIDFYFAKNRNYPALDCMKQTKIQGVGYDVVMQMALSLTEGLRPELEKRLPALFKEFDDQGKFIQSLPFSYPNILIPPVYQKRQIVLCESLVHAAVALNDREPR